MDKERRNQIAYRYLLWSLAKLQGPKLFSKIDSLASYAGLIRAEKESLKNYILHDMEELGEGRFPEQSSSAYRKIIYANACKVVIAMVCVDNLKVGNHLKRYLGNIVQDIRIPIQEGREFLIWVVMVSLKHVLKPSQDEFLASGKKGVYTNSIEI